MKFYPPQSLMALFVYTRIMSKSHRDRDEYVNHSLEIKNTTFKKKRNTTFF